jgi:hypothetical protein
MSRESTAWRPAPATAPGLGGFDARQLVGNGGSCHTRRRDVEQRSTGRQRRLRPRLSLALEAQDFLVIRNDGILVHILDSELVEGASRRGDVQN